MIGPVELGYWVVAAGTVVCSVDRIYMRTWTYGLRCWGLCGGPPHWQVHTTANHQYVNTFVSECLFTRKKTLAKTLVKERKKGEIVGNFFFAAEVCWWIYAVFVKSWKLWKFVKLCKSCKKLLELCIFVLKSWKHQCKVYIYTKQTK